VSVNTDSPTWSERRLHDPVTALPHAAGRARGRNDRAPGGASGHAPGARRTRVMVGVLALGGFVGALTHTLVLPLLPILPETLGTSPAATSWVATVTLLAGAVTNPVVGRLGDMFGKRRMLIVSLVMLVVGSLVGAVAGSLTVLLVARVLQGMGIGVIPLGVSILRDELPADKVGGGIALVSATLGIGSGMGLPLAGVMTDSLGWHSPFWMLAGAATIVLVLVLTCVDESPVRSPARFDLVGAAGLTVTLVAMLLVINRGTDWGWTSVTTIGLATMSLVVGAGWTGWERRRTAPLVDLAVTLRRPVLLTNAAGLFAGFAMFSQFLCNLTLITMPASTGYGFGKSILVAGVTQLPGAVVMVLLSPVSARLSAARGPRLTLTVGAVLLSAGYAVRLVLNSELWHLTAGAVVVYAGIGLAYGAFPALIMANVPVSETAAANAANALARVVGSTIGSAVTSAVLAGSTVIVAGEAYPSEGAFVTVNAVAGVAAAGAALIANRIPEGGGDHDAAEPGAMAA
jgi:MFS family permease